MRVDQIRATLLQRAEGGPADGGSMDATHIEVLLALPHDGAVPLPPDCTGLVLGAEATHPVHVLRAVAARYPGREVVLLDPAATLPPDWWSRLSDAALHADDDGSACVYSPLTSADLDVAHLPDHGTSDLAPAQT